MGGMRKSAVEKRLLGRDARGGIVSIETSQLEIVPIQLVNNRIELMNDDLHIECA